MVSAGVALVLVFNAVLVAAGLVLAVYLFLGRRPGAAGRGATVDADDWHAEAASLATEVRAVVEEAEGVTVADDEDSISRRLLPLSTRLRSHARAAPAGVDEEALERLHALGRNCYEVGMEHTTDRAARTGVFLEERLSELDETAASLVADLPDEDG